MITKISIFIGSIINIDPNLIGQILRVITGFALIIDNFTVYSQSHAVVSVRWYMSMNPKRAPSQRGLCRSKHVYLHSHLHHYFATEPMCERERERE